MALLSEMLVAVKRDGYEGANANARVCQDVILDAIAHSAMNRSLTIKGGVVMRSISGDARRATQDMDIDFIRYSLSDESIERFVHALNEASRMNIERIGSITELKQQDYHGKRIFLRISDDEGFEIESKVDLGVHKHMDIEQIEYCFDIANDEDGASLLINSAEQMFTEKLRSLLKFGRFSTRYKDIFDMYYLSEAVNIKRLLQYIDVLIIEDSGMRENDLNAIKRRCFSVFENRMFREALQSSKKNWTDAETDEVLLGMRQFINNLK